MNIRFHDENDLGIVTKKTFGNYSVDAGGRIIACELASRVYQQANDGNRRSKRRRRSEAGTSGFKTADPVVVGDEVRFVESANGSGQIVEVLPRRNQLSRRSAVPMPGARPHEQVIVANVDQVVPVFAAASPAPKWNLLDRYLVSAEANDLPALVCITKMDLAPDDASPAGAGFQAVLEEYRRAGYPLVQVCALTGAGLDELRTSLQGRVSVLVGKSGVGKSSLLNALQPGLGLRVNEVSRIRGRGKHTTTYFEMFPLDSGGAIVDTPGVREFGLWDVDEDELAYFFPEMRPFLGRCRFGLDCRHDEEPGCAVREAVVAGQISPRRYQSYMHLKEDY